MKAASSANPTPTLTAVDHERLHTIVHGRVNLRAEAMRLAELLGHARIVEPQQIPSNVVTMNSRVSFEDDASKKTYDLSLVYPWDADIGASKLSVLTPVGCALLGAVEGQSVRLNGRDGRAKRLIVKQIHYQPEANGVDLGDEPKFTANAPRSLDAG
jgi:regulator of nucleoside diphosphate kinase